MNRVLLRYIVVFIALFMILTGGFTQQISLAVAETSLSKAAQSTASQPATQPAGQGRAGALRNTGFKAAMDGNFKTALEDLRKSAKLDPADKATGEAIGLLENYLKRRAIIEVQRNEEYQYEIDRIKWASLAQKYCAELKAKPFAKTLRKKIRIDLAEAYHAIGTSARFEECSAEEAATMKIASLENIEKVRRAIQEAVAFFKDDLGPFAKEFRVEAKTLEKRLDACGNIWQAAKTTTPKERWTTARKLRKIEDQLADAITDIDVMITKSPWKIGLLHTRIARNIAPDKEKLCKSKWYIDLLKDTERRGLEAIAQAKWYDALSAFMGLEELDPDNDSYKEQVAKVRRHVRARRLYGKENDNENGDKNGDDDVEAKKDEKKEADKVDRQLWKDMVAGVDAQMVRKAISKLGTSYVKAPDYRKLTRGALESVKVLVQTPQVAETFPGLKDKAKQAAFLATIAKELESLDKKDRVDHLDLQTALNRLMYSCEETVNIPLEVLVVEFTDGFLNKLDKFSNMVWPYEVINFNKSTMGKFTGIGVQITKERNKPLKVITPLLDTPAYKAKIKAGDLILEVDGVSTKKLTIEELVKRIMGPPGSTVELTIKRRGLAEPFKVPVVRQDVHIRTVKGWQRDKSGKWDFMLQNGKGRIGYIRITQFTGTTHRDINKALKKMQKAGAVSLILDLRSNPGGLLRSATAVADEFLDDVRRIVFTRGRQVPRNEINSTPKGTFQTGNMVVLLDRHSASAAEILSGALKDYSRGIIVGQRSYGKGSVQNVIPVRSQEAYLKLTTAYYYLPSGRLLHRQNKAKDWGVNPDIDVYVTPKQMRRWLLLRRKTDLLQEVVPEILAADLAGQYEADLQLNTAVLMLQLMNLQTKCETEQCVAVDSRENVGR